MGCDCVKFDFLLVEENVIRDFEKWEGRVEMRGDKVGKVEVVIRGR